ncbi:MAG: ribokinase [Chloroflexi bacterium]|nr:ribokinase [Chloroflexota bacterium]
MVTTPAELPPRPVLVAGAINTDLVARVAKAPDAGETVTGSTFAIFGGGKGANQAIAAARSGAPTAMFGALGDDDFGRQRRADLEGEGIDTGSVARSTIAASGVALIVVEEETGQNRISYVPGATMTLTPEQAQDAVDRVKPAIVMTTLEPPPETIDALLNAGNKIGASIVLNATPEAIGARPLLGRTAVLVVNETEAEDLLGYAVSAANGEKAALALSTLGPATAVVTLGAAGAAVAHDGKAASLPAPRVDVVDTTGAGDAFCGAFAAELARGADPFTAARIGVVAGSLATTVPGAYPGIPRRDAVEQLLARA